LQTKKKKKKAFFHPMDPILDELWKEYEKMRSLLSNAETRLHRLEYLNSSHSQRLKTLYEQEYEAFLKEKPEVNCS
jgi:hypothetical protein